MNEIFRPHIHKIRTIPYRSRAEKAADRALEHFAWAPESTTWAEINGSTWRVLLERHQQILVMASALEARGERVMTHLPDALPDGARLPALTLLWLHGMQLPFPVRDRSRLELPESGLDPSFRLQ
ncbi:hypothetical protein [Thioalkalivibrio sp. ALMg9]|uniref:hypothetical protein n=1 Tax=Thioalkalivibrio sp. ALMg9 TaxID=1266912 RepID=UPI0012DF5F92|nr:hypothetical protein [Thioalkalivibrio sp. ALMg9]